MDYILAASWRRRHRVAEQKKQQQQTNKNCEAGFLPLICTSRQMTPHSECRLRPENEATQKWGVGVGLRHLSASMLRASSGESWSWSINSKSTQIEIMDKTSFKPSGA